MVRRGVRARVRWSVCGFGALVALTAGCVAPPSPPPDSTTTTTAEVTTTSASTTTTEATTTTTTGPPAPAAPRLIGRGRNALGTGGLSLLTGVPTEGFWLAVSGACASKENGDSISAITDANADAPTTNGGGAWASCTGGTTEPNADYDPRGYTYEVVLPRDVTGAVTIEAYDAPLCAGSSPGDGSTGTFTTQFTVRLDDGADPWSGTVLADVAMAPSSCSSTTNRWTALASLTDPAAGRYIVQVRSVLGQTATQEGSNGFGLRARLGSAFSLCTADPNDQPGVPFDPACPELSAAGRAGVYVLIPSGAPSLVPIAAVGPEGDGRTLQLDLWDPGEGSRALQVIDPAGNPAPFAWEVRCSDGGPGAGPCGDAAPTGGWSGVSGTVSTNSGTVPDGLDLYGTGPSCTPSNPQPGLHRMSCSKYSDRLVRVTVPLPADSAGAYSGRTQWSLRYHAGIAPTDRTTWAAAIR